MSDTSSPSAPAPWAAAQPPARSAAPAVSVSNPPVASLSASVMASAKAPAGAILDDQPATVPARTIWGLDPQQLHTRYWAAHGVQVVRRGEPSEIVKHAELFLLTESSSLALFSLAPLMDALNWIKPQVLFVRLHDAHERGYRENVVTDDAERFVKFQRVYDASTRLARVALTPDREIAQLWQSAPDPLTGWRRLRRFTSAMTGPFRTSTELSMAAHDSRELACFLHDLLLLWKRPDSTVLRVKSAGLEVWKDPAAIIDPSAKFIGPVWVGAGRTIEQGATVIGPAVVWDHPDRRPAIEEFQWLDIEPTEPPEDPNPRGGSVFDRASKRTFDLIFSTIGILFTLPLYPLIMLAIWIEDGRPFFFAHRRETLGGREFPCVKFRSMRKDAEKMKAMLRAKNQADGPQFFIEKDPRLTRIGALLRRYNLDELPQFFNVLAGHMSIVGPRPSPHSENQYCPPSREARLSVRPGDHRPVANQTHPPQRHRFPGMDQVRHRIR